MAGDAFVALTRVVDHPLFDCLEVYSSSTTDLYNGEADITSCEDNVQPYLSFWSKQHR